MSKNMLKNKTLFILGIITAILMGAIFAFNGLIFYKAGIRLIIMASQRCGEKKILQVRQLVSKFDIGFESPDDIKIFETKESTAAISDNFAVEGKRSLMVEFPSGASYPGISFELSGRNCLDWSDMKELSFDVRNTVNLPALLTVKIKSGESYPKKEFQKNFTIPAAQTITLSINRQDLKDLDLRRISYLNFFMNDPSTTFQLNFDNIKIIKDSNEK